MPQLDRIDRAILTALQNNAEHLRRLTILSFTSRPEVSRIETSLVFSNTRLGLPVDHAHGDGIPPR